MSRDRLDFSTFDLPIHELRRGYRSDIYFWRSKLILENDDHNPHILIQVFQKNGAVLCGVDEAVSILKVATGFYLDRKRAYKLFDRLIDIKKEIRSLYPSKGSEYISKIKEKLEIQDGLERLWDNRFGEIKVSALFDGDGIRPFEPVLTVEGPGSFFIHLETLYLGVLARRTRVATNVNRVVRAALNKPVLFFPARFDHWACQGGDGYAARIGGATLVSTDAQAAWWGAEGGGTIPHSLIACYGGDTVLTARKFAENFKDERCIALVDFENNCVKTSLEVARGLGERLYAVRLDTSETLVDVSVQQGMGQFVPTGVCRELVFNVREALDREGFGRVKIIVSGGFSAEKISSFEAEGVPVDAYGVGSSLLSGNFDFTADVVSVGGKPMAKAGRSLVRSTRLKAT